LAIAWENFRGGAEEYRDLGESVLVLNFFSGVGKTSGLEVAHVQTRGASVFELREGKVTRLLVYADRAQAFADLGLTSDTGSSGL
jgi:ketosteroid isomerase-like protein